MKVPAGEDEEQRELTMEAEHEVAQVCPFTVPGLSLSHFLWTIETCSEQKWRTRSR